MAPIFHRVEAMRERNFEFPFRVGEAMPHRPVIEIGVYSGSARRAIMLYLLLIQYGQPPAFCW